jgi:hypothetical protein
MKITLFPVVLLGAMLFACEGRVDPKPSSVWFPIGRSFLGVGEMTATLNGLSLPLDTVYDKSGGYWLQIVRKNIKSGDQVVIEYARKSGSIKLYKARSQDANNWLNEGPFIDCDNELFRSKALEITQGSTSRIDQAKQIQKFVANHVRLQVYKDSFLDEASKTYELGYGTCMNYSRLFISLCRSIGIPARSVWGVIYGYNNDAIYDYHHQWAEILDESGYWHPLDFSYTRNFDLTDVRYLDLLYAAEENSFLESRAEGELQLGNVTFFGDYPAALTGRLGFQLVEDKRPDYMKVKYVYKF